METLRMRQSARHCLPKDRDPELVPYEDLIAYAEGELDASASALIATHVASCDVCAAEVERCKSNRVKTR